MTPPIHRSCSTCAIISLAADVDVDVFLVVFDVFVLLSARPPNPFPLPTQAPLPSYSDLRNKPSTPRPRFYLYITIPSYPFCSYIPSSHLQSSLHRLTLSRLTLSRLTTKLQVVDIPFFTPSFSVCVYAVGLGSGLIPRFLQAMTCTT
jgi:hypothetical protein